MSGMPFLQTRRITNKNKDMKKAIRLFIVHQFALGYQIRIGKLKLRTVRASRIIAPLFILTGILMATDKTPDVLQWYDWICISLTGLSLFFGFVYNELDDFQKVQYEIFYFGKLTCAQRDEIEKIKLKHPEWV
jgi:hypothetical protein